jgi:chaperonin GroEL
LPKLNLIKMIPKHVYLDGDGQDKLKAGIKKLSGAVKSTLGPFGRNVIMESENHVGGTTITKDGVSVAKNINLYDPVENLAVTIVKEAANRTASVAGDGTSTSIVLTEALLDEAEKMINDKTNVTEVIRHMNDIKEDVIKYLSKKSKKVTDRNLLDVATISSNNDPVLGKLIADMFKKVKVVTVEDSKTPTTHTDVIEGLKFDRGYSSVAMITNEEMETCELINPFILLTDMEINNLSHMEKILVPIMQADRSLLIIGRMSPAAINTFNLNIKKGNIKGCHVEPPNHGYRQKEMMRDLEAAFDAKFYSEEIGDGLHLITSEGLGNAAKAIISKDRTVLYRKDGQDDEKLQHRLEELRSKLTGELSLFEKKDITDRISNIDGGVGIIYVGANSPVEAKEKKDRADDAVRAVSAAMEDGIIAGGGVSLFNATSIIPVDHFEQNKDLYAAREIMSHALMIPFKQIIINAGQDPRVIMDEIEFKAEEGYGKNLKTGKFGNMIKMGVTDPTLVTKSALNNAVSVATTIISSSAIITNMRADESVK